MQIDAVTLFPAMFESILCYGVSQRGLDLGLWRFTAWNPRDFKHDKYRRVDDRPYGGGPGMILQVEPLAHAISAAKSRQVKVGVERSHVIYLSPGGFPLTQAKAAELSRCPGLILLCGRYEGVDERLIRQEVDEVISIGDYVLSGGELPAMVLIDALLRLVPGVLNDPQSAEEDSFSDGLLDCPHYTRPQDYHGMPVPAVLLSGNHSLIAQWRLKEALGRTMRYRPDLLKDRVFTKQESRLLAEYQQEQELHKNKESK